MRRGQGTRLVVLLLLSATLVRAQAPAPLKLEKTIELAEVAGRIDHMSLDVKAQRLFVSALGNNTVEVIDLKAFKRTNTISGLREPQGVLYMPASGRLFVASSKDGTVKIFDGTSFQLLETIEYGHDADNLRYDSSRERIYVGYGSGGLGELNAEGQKVVEIQLGSHPESFQLEKASPRIYVNLPKGRKIAVVDRAARLVTGSWSTGLSLANYAMALDEADHRLFVVTRFPPRLLVIDTENGKTVQTLPAVGDCDDIFFDQARKRIYAIGGEGAISVFEQKDADHYREMLRMPTVKGARTGFFSPDLERLYVAVRRQGSTPAMIEIFDVRVRNE
jgi:DNA-binding beta-propeller fold protein YncE